MGYRNRAESTAVSLDIIPIESGSPAQPGVDPPDSTSAREEKRHDGDNHEQAKSVS
jgi:hypothetical protein